MTDIRSPRPWLKPLAVITAVGLCLFVAGTGVVLSLKPKQEVIATDNLAQPILPTLTASPVPTPTTDLLGTVTVLQQVAAGAQADAQNSRLEAISAKETAVAMELEIKRLEAQRTEAVWTATAQVGIWTAQAYPTSVPLTEQARGTAVAMNEESVTRQAAWFAATLQAPTTAAQLYALNYSRKYGERDAAVGAVVRVMFGFAAVVFSLVLAGWALAKIWAVLASKWHSGAKQDAEMGKDTSPGVLDGFSQLSDKPIEPSDIELERTSESTWTRIEPEIPATLQQLLEFAEAVTDGERRLGIHRWDKAHSLLWTVDDYMPFRQWLRENGFTEPAARGGEVQISPRGLAFLREVVTVGTPPLPYHIHANGAELRETERSDGAFLSEGEGMEEAE